jgi:hypothetical protein
MRNLSGVAIPESGSSISGDHNRPNPGILVLAMLAGLAPLGGCSARTMTVTREPVINTAFDRNGVPLSVDIVTVHPDDLKGDNVEYNRDLAPGGGITADVWFANKPTRDSVKDPNDTKHFRIDRSQIFSFTDMKKEDVYGVYCGGQIVGNKYRGAHEKDIVVRNIDVGDVFDEKGVIYVFGRFTDATGRVLPTKPAEFWRVGDYVRNLEVRIAENDMRRVTDRTFRKSEDTKAPVTE